MKNTTKRIYIKFGSKADTLHQLQGLTLSCQIPKFYSFTWDCWMQDSANILQSISERFKTSAKVAVRSSASCEDGITYSHAGSFTSVLNVNPHMKESLRQAIKKVWDSYTDINGNDQVMIQDMVNNIDVSGVILTRCVDDGSPYYVLNYDEESGSTESITAGKGVHKTVLVYRYFKPEYCDSNRVRRMLDLALEIESYFELLPLDIEFALDNSGRMHLLQVRRISTVGKWHPDAAHRVTRIIPCVERFVSDLSIRRKGLFGSFTVFGNMPDWNPAELIGVIPSPLSASLFRLLISSQTWSKARAQMGYRRLPRTELMVIIGGRAFIDARASFNSFLPENIPNDIGEKLVNAWLQRLSDNPNLHDKIEFEIVHTVLDFSFDDTFGQRYGNVLSDLEKQKYKNLLCRFTNNVLDVSDKGSLKQALKGIDNLSSRQSSETLNFETNSPTAMASHIACLLEDCFENGTIPFTIIARHAFIAEALLRSAIVRGALSTYRISEFKTSFNTIMGNLAEDTIAVCDGRLDENEFLERFGHLRPGTFDIMSPCYRDRPGLLDRTSNTLRKARQTSFRLTTTEEKEINLLLKESGICSVDSQDLISYAKWAIRGREYAKFIFTRNLSAALESIAIWGAMYGLGREDLSLLSIRDILDTCFYSTTSEQTSLLMQKVDQARINQSLAKVFKLSYLVRDVRDIHVVPVHRSEPNFITQKQIEQPIIFLEATTINYGTLKGIIVCIENADPGFDWIFTKGVTGLITKYGGANSHMAIRCAELQLPAAIGCGEELFERLRLARKVELNCNAKIIRPIGVYG